MARAKQYLYECSQCEVPCILTSRTKIEPGFCIETQEEAKWICYES